MLRSGGLDPTLVRDAAAPGMSGPEYERTLVEVLFVLPGDRVTYEGVFLLAQGIKRKMLDKNDHLVSGGKKGKCEKVTEDGEDPQALVNETLLLFEWDDKDLKEGDDCLASMTNLYADYPKCDHLTDTKMTSCGLDALYMAAWQKLYDALQTREGEQLPPPPELALPATMMNMARTLVAELLMLDEGFGYESEHMLAQPLDGGTEVREMMTVAWDHDEPVWRMRNPDDPDVGLLERMHCTEGLCPLRDDFRFQRIAPFWGFYFAYEPFLALVRAHGPQFLVEANATIQSTIADRRAQYAAGYWDRHEARWGFYGKQWAPKFPDLVYTFRKKRREHLFTKPSPTEELDWTEDWMVRRARVLEAWLPTVQPKDVHYEDVDLQADFMSEPMTIAGMAAGSATAVGLMGLGGIGAYRMLARSRPSTAGMMAVPTADPGPPPALLM